MSPISRRVICYVQYRTEIVNAQKNNNHNDDDDENGFVLSILWPCQLLNSSIKTVHYLFTPVAATAYFSIKRAHANLQTMFLSDIDMYK